METYYYLCAFIPDESGIHFYMCVENSFCVGFVDLEGLPFELPKNCCYEVINKEGKVNLF